MNASQSRHLVTPMLALTVLAAPLGCDGPEGPDDIDAISSLELEFDSDGELVAAPVDDDGSDPNAPQTAEAAGKTYAEGLGLAAEQQPLAVSGWIAAVSEETPPSTCDGNQVAVGADCSGWSCDEVQLLCANHNGSAGQRTWRPWFSEEGVNSQVCPGTEWLTGVACRGYWCDDMTIECTDLGIFATSCTWSGWFGPDDPAFIAPAGRLIAGAQCRNAYCGELKYFHCSV